ncbi:MAG: hypothetical protein KKH94_11240 [Candidatus Omnitrophica bacterium]|nr:hypothetical protein [Candidatus Omnitrophota bacterium]
MSLEELWNEALKGTEIVRLPIKRLLTFGSTRFDYIFLSPSLVNQGDTAVRKGKLDVDRPTLFLPKDAPTFEGFDSDTGGGIKSEQLTSFFYARGVRFPSLQYRNEPYELDVFEGSLAKAEKAFNDEIRRKENLSTGIVIGSDVSWQFSVLLLACHMIDTHIDSDLKALMARIKKKG